MARPIWFFFFKVKERGGGVKGGNVFAWPLPFLRAQRFSCQRLLSTNGKKKMHYCRPDGNIPHDQTNQSPRWDAGVTQPCSNTPFHSLSGTNTWSPINGTPRTHEEGCSSAASVVHGWWLHNHTSILSEEEGDELPNNVSHHVGTNTVMDAASKGPTRCSPRHASTSPSSNERKVANNSTGRGNVLRSDIGIKVSVWHQSGIVCLVIDANCWTAKQTEVKDGKRIYTWVRNADPAPSTTGIFPYTENPLSAWACTK